MLTIQNISEILSKYDVEGLIEKGAPLDEYNLEANEMYIKLINLERSQMTFDKVWDIVDEVLYEYFEFSHFDSDILKNMSLDIKSLIDNTKEFNLKPGTLIVDDKNYMRMIVLVDNAYSILDMQTGIVDSNIRSQHTLIFKDLYRDCRFLR